MKNNKLIEYLQENYPSVVNETEEGNLEVNFNKLKEELNDVNISEETYGLNWMGKSYARVLRDYPVTTLIEPDNKHNNLDENKDSNNVYIEGDNLEVLKHLKNAYSNKIKMIYIDPPYNTGSDGFVYNDSFNFKVEDFMQLANVDEDEAKKILDYTTSQRSSHSAWLTFMYPRLYIARELLKEDGVIFISIDDNEQAQLKILCDEIFGEDNFLGQIVVKVNAKKQKISKPNIGTEHEYILCYSKTNDFKMNFVEDSNYKFIIENFDKIYNENCSEKMKIKSEIIFNQNKGLRKYKYKDENGIFRDDNINMSLGRGGKYNIFTNDETKLVPPKHGWPSIEKMLDFDCFEEKNNDLYFKGNIITLQDGKKTYGPLVWGDNTITYCKTYLDERVKMSSLILNYQGSDDSYLQTLMGTKKTIFSYPKIINLIEKIIDLGTDENDTVLDFFSGSSTTAQAVLELNAKDNGNRKYIMVQLPEEIDEEKSKEAYEFCTKELKQEPIIPTIAKERIKRAAKKIKEENKDKEYINDIDFGFKVYKTIEDKRTKLSDIKEFDVNQKLLFDTDNLEALLTTWMLYDGYDLNTKVENFSINKYNGYLVESTLYLMDKDFSTKDLKTLVEKLSDEQTPIINRIVINEVNFTNKMLAEINEQVFDKNIKEVNINVIKRV